MAAFCPEKGFTMPKDPHTTPIDVVTEGGEILLDGPNGLAESFTPKAARQSANRLRKAAREADNRHVETAEPDPEP